MRWCAAVIIGVIWCLAAPVHADPRADIVGKTRAAMASYDALDYDAARRLLNQALATAKRSRLDKDPIVARVYLDLGITQLAGSDPEAARVSFLSAVQIDPKIAIEPAYRSAELVRMLDEARSAAGDGGGEPVSDDCRAVRGLQPVAIEGARRGVAQPVEVRIGADLSPARVVVMYRAESAIDFTELRLSRQSGCRYVGTIPASAMRGALVHYYIAAYDANNKVLAARGSSAAPSVLDLVAGNAAPHGAAEPAAGAPETASATAVGVVGHPAAGHPASRFAVAVSGGTGLGYVSGKTEGGNVVQSCCLGASPFVGTAELRYRVNPRLSLGGVVRAGFPLGANIAGHSTIAPAGFVRVGYAFSDSGAGLHVMGELGIGILRNTIKLDATTPGMDTDVVAQGPLLVGAGIGYAWRVGARVSLFADLDAIASVAVVDKLSSAINLHTGISGDLRGGVALGF